jgi:hypothetical protein
MISAPAEDARRASSSKEFSAAFLPRLFLNATAISNALSGAAVVIMFLAMRLS